MTGVEIRKTFESKVDKAYSKYLDNAKLNRIFKEAITSLAEQKWMGLSTQKEYDELRYMVKTEVELPVRGGRIHISPVAIQSMSAAAGLVRIKTVSEHNLIAGETVVFSGVDGIVTQPNIDGSMQVHSIVNGLEFNVLSSFISGQYTPFSGSVVVPNSLSDYLHIFAMMCKVPESMNLEITSSSRATPTTIILSKRANIRNGDKLIISSFSDPAVNGVRYAKHLTDNKVSLFLDKNLTMPVAGNGSNVSGGVVQRMWEEYGEPTFSNRKISKFEEPRPDSPKYETADGFIKIYPEGCKGVKVDYFAAPAKYIDVSDSTTDYELLFPAKFLYRLINEAIRIYSVPSRDPLLEAMTTREAQINK